MSRAIRLIIAMILVAGAGAGTPLRADQAVVAILNTQQLPVLSGPGGDFDQVDMFYAGNFLTLRESRGDWLRVEAARFGTPVWGWVWGGAIRPLRDPVEWREVADPQDPSLNLRAGPGTGHDISLKMPNGSRAMVLADEGNWRYVRHDSGTHGWAWSAALIAAKQVPPPKLPGRAGGGQ